MQLRLGRHSFDVGTRGLVVGQVSAAEVLGGRLPTAKPSPAIIELTGADQATVAPSLVALSRAFAGPVIVETGSAAVADAAIRAGADALHCPDGLGDPAYLRTVEPTSVALIISVPVVYADSAAYLLERARWAEAAGLDRSRIVLRVPIAAVSEVASLGYVIMIDPVDGNSAQGEHVLAMKVGARLFASNDVRATKRTIDTVSELLERREPVGAH